jgi:hypothetical protein
VREVYPRYLATGFHVTRGMIHLMEAALERARALAPEDAVAAGLAEYLERHLYEEMHDEEPGGAVLDDLAALGFDIAPLFTEPPSPKIAGLVGAQYYWIFHYHPVSILGFLELEAFHPNVEVVERLIAATGLPREGFRQLLLHARLDVAHADDLHRVLDSLPLEPRHEQLVGLSALHTIGTLSEALVDVVEERAPTAEAAPAP